MDAIYDRAGAAPRLAERRIDPISPKGNASVSANPGRTHDEHSEPRLGAARSFAEFM